MKNYYEILEVNSKASKEIIEKAYKTLVKRYHPDLYSSVQKKETEEKLKDLNEAYNILSDNFLREQYDIQLKKDMNEELKNSRNYRNTYNINNKPDIEEQKRYEKEDKTVRDRFKMNKQRNNVGTVFGIIELLKNLFSNRPKKLERKKLDKTDVLAIGLTILVILILGIILWFIPFTNNWMRELLFENPLFNLIGSIFS